MSTIVTAGARKTVGKDAAFEVFAKRLTHVGARCVVVALAVELASAGQRMPGLEVFGYCAVQQGPLGVARVVELGLGKRWPTRVWMRVRLRGTCGGGHGTVPAWTGCPMILGLYPALVFACVISRQTNNS